MSRASRRRRKASALPCNPPCVSLAIRCDSMRIWPAEETYTVPFVAIRTSTNTTAAVTTRQARIMVPRIWYCRLTAILPIKGRGAPERSTSCLAFSITVVAPRMTRVECIAGLAALGLAVASADAFAGSVCLFCFWGLLLPNFNSGSLNAIHPPDHSLLLRHLPKWACMLRCPLVLRCPRAKNRRAAPIHPPQAPATDVPPNRDNSPQSRAVSQPRCPAQVAARCAGPSCD